MEEAMEDDLSQEEVNEGGESGKVRTEGTPSKDAKTRKAILARKTALENPMMMDALRRTTLGLKENEVIGRIPLVVPRRRALHLPPAPPCDGSESSRATLCRRFERLHPSRREDDAHYLDAVERGAVVTLVAALPAGHEAGGWRCHAEDGSTVASDRAECLRANAPEDERCARCRGPRPRLRPEFARLRLLSPGLRRQRGEYVRIIEECDSELERCDAAECEATERIAAYERDLDDRELGAEAGLNCTDENDAEPAEVNAEEELMMDVDLVQIGAWQRVNARILLPKLAERKVELNNRLAKARAELAIMVQGAFSLAVLHAQRVSRRFLVRLRLDEIRKSVLEFARFSAAVEIQRIARSRLASTEADRLRTIRDHRMATKIQSVVRRGAAIAERRRRWAIYMEQLRNRSATIIQSMYRCHACKVLAKQLAEERRRQLEAAERARAASLERDSAVAIQKHCRRILSKARCSNRRIELGLHQRLLMYLERYVVDGCMWSFVKSINDDYIRYERTITHTIEREEKMAKTFVEKVINTRDGDHTSAWENYKKSCIKSPDRPGKSRDSSTAKDGGMHDARTRKPSPKDKKEVGWHGNHRSAMKIYGSPPQRRTMSSRRSNSRKATPKSREKNSDEVPIETQQSSLERTDDALGPDEVGESQTDGGLGQSYQQEAKRLARLNQTKERLRGRYLRFDIPDGLDDTVSRFLMAVTMRYKFETPGESSLHGNFESKSAEKEHQQSCVAYAEPLIQRLHGMGVVFIRQLLPADRMVIMLSNLGVTEEFLLLSTSLLRVLHQMSGGKRLNRKYLMSRCRDLMDSQRSYSSKAATDAHFSLASFLGECGAAGSDSYDDGDNPGGIWMPKARCSDQNQDKCKQESNDDKAKHLPLLPHAQHAARKTRSRSWVIPYTAKIITENESKHPALVPYRHGQLLGPG